MSLEKRPVAPAPLGTAAGDGAPVAPAALVASPSLAEVAALAAADPTLRRVPVKRELYADRLTPVEAMRALRAASNHCFMLESAEADQRWGRYTFLGCNPSVEVTCANGTVNVRRGVEGSCAAPEVETFAVDHPGTVLRDIIAQNKSPQLAGFPPFSGGLVGYFSYDYIKYAEPILRPDPARGATCDPAGQHDFLDMDLMLFDQLVVFDAYRQKIVLIAGVQVGADVPALGEAYAAAVDRLDRLEQILTAGPRMQFEPLHLERDLAPRFSAEEYADMVRAAQHYIHEGDIFQVVLSNPQTAPATGSLFDAYRVLRTRNPSPYMFYFTSDDVEIAGASPETLVKLDAGRLYTYPLAGTRPRGATPEEDGELERGLLADEKELAEHNMLVDLGRNDLGRISELGSVRVEEYLNVLKFSRVMHIGSTVTGRIAATKDAVDAVDAILPAGTLSGAPKLRACQIIDELEGTQRGIYGGAIGYLDLSGNLDTCIAIRLSYKKNGTVVVQSGAGIVADSVPASEAQECVNKARAVVEALHEAEGGLA